MDDRRLGLALRAIRVRKGWRQLDLSVRTGVPRSTVGQIERGRLGSMRFATIRAVADALDARIDVTVRWHGGDLDRLLNARHAAMQEGIARLFAAVEGWIAEPEVSFSVYGERGVADVLGWNADARVVLVIELKTEFVDVNELMGTLDRKRRLARNLARDRDWDARAVASWVIVADNRTNRRALAVHEAVLRSKFPTDGRAMRGWLRRPDGPRDGMSFMPWDRLHAPRRDLAPIRRVNRRR
jgi:transcriptional regulator with XRE-family HTH domain